MNWIDVPSDIIRKNIDTFKELTLNDIINITITDKPIVFFPNNIYKGIVNHLSSNLSTELGGILLGDFYVDNNDRVRLIVIQNFIESKNYNSTGVSLSMNTDIWQEVNKLTENEDSNVIGWYHSHPNLGAFFSSTDRYTQRHFFNNDYSLGLVIDPIRKEEKYFLNKESEELNFSNVIRKNVELD